MPLDDLADPWLQNFPGLVYMDRYIDSNSLPISRGASLETAAALEALCSS